MRVVDLSPEREFDYLSCLRATGDGPDEAQERKREWFAQYRDRGLVVKLAEDEDRNIVGMIHSLPIEETWLQGSNLDIIMCVRVSGPRSRHVGARASIAGLLLQALEASVRGRGRQGLAALGLGVPVWMKRNWFPAHGYRVIGRQGACEMLFKPFGPNVGAPRLLPEQHLREQGRGLDTGGCFADGWCPAASMTHDRAPRCSKADPPRGVPSQPGAVPRPRFVSAPYLRRGAKPQR